MAAISATDVQRVHRDRRCHSPRHAIACKGKWTWLVTSIIVTAQFVNFCRQSGNLVTKNHGSSEAKFLAMVSQSIEAAASNASGNYHRSSSYPNNAAAILHAEHDLMQALSERTTHTIRTTTGGSLQLLPQQQLQVGIPIPIQGGLSLERKLPDWYLTTECSVYDIHCLPRRLATGLYGRYPFPFRPSRLIPFLKDYSSKTIANGEQQLQWEPTLTAIPDEWTSRLEVIPKRREVAYTYPTPASSAAERDCLRRAETLSWRQQLDVLLETRLVKEQDETNGMVAFTISDYQYAWDMMHDFFEMNNRIVGFDGGLFLVALDRNTVELACRYDYPIVAWPSSLPKNDNSTTAAGNTKSSSSDALRDAVVNTKLDVSHQLVLRNTSFFFYEMDVWFFLSPKSLIPPAEDFDMMFSVHSNCANCVNIGVYSVRANERTREYFELCQQLQGASPDTHDQWIMGQVLHLTTQYLDPNKNHSMFRFEEDWNPVPPDHLNPPPIKFPVHYGFFPPHEIVTFERPQPLPVTRAIHPLSGGPLRSPHSKKIMAKELGAWYGFRGKPNEQGEMGGYYHRTGSSFRRYIWLDGPSLNVLSLTNIWYQKLKWTLAMLLALANRTGRIVVLPAIQHEWGHKFAWTMLDMQSVETLTDKEGNRLNLQVRETNFPNNYKAWARSSVPFRNVVRTALGDVRSDRPEEHRMYLQYGDTSLDAAVNASVIQAWNLTLSQGDAVDAWWAIATGAASAEVNNAELLLVYNRLFWEEDRYYHNLMQRVHENETLSRAEQEINDIFVQLRWCLNLDKDKTVGYTSATWDCYGKGKPSGKPWNRNANSLDD